MNVRIAEPRGRLLGYFLVAVFLCCAPYASADDEGFFSKWVPNWFSDQENLVVTILDPYADMHTGPGRGFPIDYVIERGETATLLKRRTDWIKVETAKGRRGWVHRDDLNLTLGPDDYLVEFNDPTIEDYVSRRWSGGFAAGDFAGADALSAFIGYRFSNNLSTELKVTQAIGNFSNSFIVGASMVHEPFPEWRVSPFFSIGVGSIKTTPDATLVQTEDRTDTIMMVGIGAQAYISRQFMLRVEYTNNLILTSRDENDEVNEWKIGFNVFF